MDTETPSFAAPPPPPPPPPPGALHDTSRLTRSTSDRHIAGVAGGIAAHFGVDPLVVRIAFVALAFFGGSGVALYLLGWLLLPEDHTDESMATSLLHHQPGQPWNRNALVLAVIAGVLTLGAFDHPHRIGVVGPLLLVALLVVVLSRRNGGHGSVGGPPPFWGPPSGGPPFGPPPSWGPGQQPTAAPPAPPTPHPAPDLQPGTDADPGAGTGAGTGDAPLAGDPSTPEAVAPEPSTPEATVPDPLLADLLLTDPSLTDPLLADPTLTDPLAGLDWGPLGPWPAPAPAPLPVPVRSRRGRHITAATLSAVVAVGGVVLLLDLVGVGDVGTHAFAAAALIVTGIGLAVSAFQGRAWGLIPLALGLAALLVLSNGPGDFGDGVGARRVHPSAAAALQSQYKLAVGNLVLDLRDVNVAEGVRHARADVAVGHLLVIVPAGERVDVTARTGAGGVEVFGRESHGTDVVLRSHDGPAGDSTAAAGAGAAQLDLDLRAGIGQIEVRRAA